MIISPTLTKYRNIGNLLGAFIVGFSFTFIVPIVVAILYQEVAPLCDFLIAFFISLSLGLFLLFIFPQHKEIGVFESFFSVGAIWLIASLLGAIPLYLSGHWHTFLDAYFETMSGFTTTGLVLVSDLDHLSMAHNIWRHLTMFIGGQGIIVAGISLLSSGASFLWNLYVGEARQEKILPNIIDSARFIWRISFVYLILGGIAGSIILILNGMIWDRAIFHSICLFMAGFDTGGFTPQSQSINYYHNNYVEVLTLIFMLLGAINFSLHFWIWYRKKGELLKNLEIRTFLFSFTILFVILFFSLSKLGISNKNVIYQLISAHTGCGFTNLASYQLPLWGTLPLFILTLSMLLGGSVGSTSGGIKLLRVGMVFKTIASEVKKYIYPSKAVYFNTYHHLKDVVLSEDKLRNTFIIVNLYIISWLLGSIILMMSGYSLSHSLFECASALGNVGLSLGITQPLMPTHIKVLFILLMWLGRLEFLTVFVPIGFILTSFKK